MKKQSIEKILDFLTLAERLKTELRHSWLSNGRQESVAEHCWQMSLLALLLYQHLECSVNLEKTLKMIITHDIVEAEVGDIPYFEKGYRKKMKLSLERKAIENIRKMFSGEDMGEEIYNLWHEFENGNSNEAKFARALDNLEVQIQHNLAPLNTWQEVEYDLVYTKMDKFCSHDSFLQALCDAVKLQAEKKIQSAGVNIDTIKKRIKYSDNQL